MEWFYAQNGQQMGPVTEANLGDMARTGAISPETLVWHEGMGDWQPYRQAAASTPPPLHEPLRFCNSCGNQFPAGDLAMFGESAICAGCKPAYVQRLRQGMTSTTPHLFEYGGFWIRFVAYMIDAIIVSIVRYAITIPLGIEGFFRPIRPGIFTTFFGLAYLISTVVGIAYYTYFWTQQGGATPGKMIFGMKVVRPDGGPITVGQAIGRYFAYILDAFTLLIGFMMAGWDSEKRALHDRLCDTRVIRTR